MSTAQKRLGERGLPLLAVITSITNRQDLVIWISASELLANLNS
jgi:hypothetical protein